MWNHAMMDFGALVCTKKKPKCQTCPMRQRCRAYPAALIMSSLRGDIRKRKQAQPFVGSTRYWRGRIVDALRNASESGLSKGQLQRIFHGALDRIRLEHILSGLRQDKLVVYRGSLVKFPR
jgi:A/G-specific adenine glycosylase